MVKTEEQCIWQYLNKGNDLKLGMTDRHIRGSPEGKARTVKGIKGNRKDRKGAAKGSMLEVRGRSRKV